MKIPLVDLRTQYQQLRAEIDAAIREVLEGGQFVRGEAVRLFEKEFASFANVKYCIGVGNGTDALELALQALDIGPGDKVVTVPNTFIATTEAITRVGAEILFTDIDKKTYTIDPESLRKVVQSHKNVRAVIPVHLYGMPCDMDPILRIAEEYDLKVINDAAQAHGALYRNRSIASYGNVSCYSFYPGKNLGAYGDAGAVVTDDPEIAEKVRMLADHGRKEKYVHETEGRNSRLDTIQAAVLRVKLKYLSKWNECRSQIADRYKRNLHGCGNIALPYVPGYATPVWHLFVVQLLGVDRDKVMNKMREKGIGVSIHYPIPLHRQPAYKGRLDHYSFPEVEEISKRILSLPIYPEMTDDMVDYVSEQLLKAVGEIIHV